MTPRHELLLAGAWGIGVLLGAHSAGGGVVATVVAVAVRRGRRQRAHLADVIGDRAAWSQLLSALALELRAGRSPAHALLAAAGASRTAASPTLARELRPALLAAGLPGDVGGALRRARPPPLRVLGAAWSMSERQGASLAVVVARLADGARRDAELERARAGAVAGPRASARLVAGLPALGVLLAAGLGAQPVAFLLHDPLGQLCFVAGTVLDVAALGWSARLTRPR